MDAGVTFRPQGGPAQTGMVRPDSVPVRDAARTEVSPAKAVTPPPQSAEQRPAAENGSTAAPRQDDSQVNRDVVFDSKTREVIFRVLDVNTGQVLRQIPEEAMLKLRAYNREQENPSQTDTHVVEKVT